MRVSPWPPAAPQCPALLSKPAGKDGRPAPVSATADSTETADLARRPTGALTHTHTHQSSKNSKLCLSANRFSVRGRFRFRG